MHASLWLVSALGLSIMAAPTTPELNKLTATSASLELLSDYFDLLASKVQESRFLAEAPGCDMSKIQPPIDSPLPAVVAGLTLKHIAIGRGTQNYTCDTTNATAQPVPVGAVATLFNASCVAANHMDVVNMMTKVSLQFNATEGGVQHLAPSNLEVSGHHYFNASGVPFFNLNTPGQELGLLPCTKNGSAPAPSDAPRGQKNEVAVPYLQLIAAEGATKNLQEVYRLATAGGSAPEFCTGMPKSFEIQYAAQYWFFEGKPVTEES